MSDAILNRIHQTSSSRARSLYTPCAFRGLPGAFRCMVRRRLSEDKSGLGLLDHRGR
jgi:hypothetical protein